MSREEAAAKAIDENSVETSTVDYGWGNFTTLNSAGLATEALAAADAHDAANGVHQVTPDDETVERAVKALRDEFSVDDAMGEHYAAAVWGTPEDIVRAVLESTVKEGQ